MHAQTVSTRLLLLWAVYEAIIIPQSHTHTCTHTRAHTHTHTHTHMHTHSIPQDAEIKHLTYEKHRWYDIEGRSIASRAASEAGVLSDGCLSDSAMDSNNKGKKKKKPWKVRAY